MDLYGAGGPEGLPGPRGPDGPFARGVAELRPRPRRHAPQPPRPDQRRQRGPTRPGVDLRHGLVSGPAGGESDRRGRDDVRDAHVERRLCHRRPHGRGEVALGPRDPAAAVRHGLARHPAPAGPEPLLRSRQPRGGPLRREGLRRAAERKPGRAGRRDGRGSVAGAGPEPGRRLQHHRRAPRHRRPGDHGHQRRRIRRAWLRLGLRRADGRAGLALLHGSGRSDRAVRERGPREGGRDVDRRLVAIRRRGHGVGRHGLGPGAGSPLLRGRERRPLAARHPQPRGRGQPVPHLDHGRASRHGRVRLALPDHARRRLGLRRDPAAHPGGSHH